MHFGNDCQLICSLFFCLQLLLVIAQEMCREQHEEYSLPTQPRQSFLYFPLFLEGSSLFSFLFFFFLFFPLFFTSLLFPFLSSSFFLFPPLFFSFFFPFLYLSLLIKISYGRFCLCFRCLEKVILWSRLCLAKDEFRYNHQHVYLILFSGMNDLRR